MAKEALERRYLPAAEIRMEDGEDEGEVRVSGYAAVFDKPSQDLGGFVEVIERGAFRKALEKSDVRLLINHDGIALARARPGKSGTLTLTEDETGLHYEAKLDRTSPHVQALESAMRRGDIDQSSFAFRIAKGGDEWEERDGATYRTIREVAEVFDVSPVTYPAYPDTSVAARSLEQWKEERAPEASERAVPISVLRKRLQLAESE